MDVFIELSFIIILAIFFAGLMKLLRQPLIIGYIITGIIAGPYALNILHSTSELQLFSNIGIAILLFIVGINLNPEIIKEVGETSALVAITQAVFTSVIGFFIIRLFGFDAVSAAYGGAALAFSSTIIVLKILSDKKSLDKLYGKIVVGMLLVEDLVAGLLLIIASLNIKDFSSFDAGNIILGLILKGAIVFLCLFLISKYFLPKLSSFFATSPELLFLFSIAWGLGLSSVFYLLGLSMDIGALLAGAAFAVSPFSEEIVSRLKPLRDFFLVLFFVLLGSKIAIDGNFETVFYSASVISFFVLIVNPVIVFVTMNLLGFRSRTGFMVAMTATQIGEFSLILIALGASMGRVNNSLVQIITLVGIFTIAVSSYLIFYSDEIYHNIKNLVLLFEIRKGAKRERVGHHGDYEMIIFGFHRVGEDFALSAKHIGANFVAVDFNPAAVKRLQEKNIPFKFGDADVCGVSKRA